MFSVKGLAQQVIEIDKRGGDIEVLNSFLEYLDSRGGLTLLPYVIAHLERHIEREKKSNRVVVKTPYSVSSETLSSICSYMNATKGVEIENMEDPELIGGFVAEYKFKRHDTSLRNKLDKLKTTLV